MNKQFTNEEIEQARNVDMIQFLENHLGVTFQKSGKGYVCVEHDSLHVAPDRRKWYWHSKQLGGGNAVDYLCKVEKKPFPVAIDILLGEYKECVGEKKEVEQVRQHRILSRPGRVQQYRRLFAYLTKTRRIDREIVQKLIDERRIYEDPHGNVVFCGYDEKGIARYMMLRGTCTANPYKGEVTGSDKRYGFRFGDDSGDTVYVFEAAIDAMSHATLALSNGENWQKQSRLALGGTADTALSEYLRTHPHTKRIVLCTDNDEAGNNAAEQMMDKYRGLGYAVERDCPQGKDFNEDLTKKYE